MGYRAQVYNDTVNLITQLREEDTPTGNASGVREYETLEPNTGV